MVLLLLTFHSPGKLTFTDNFTFHHTFFETMAQIFQNESYKAKDQTIEDHHKIDNAKERCIFPRHAQMAELVDALASGASDRKVVEVQVLFWAPFLLFLQILFSTFQLSLRKPLRGLFQPSPKGSGVRRENACAFSFSCSPSSGHQLIFSYNPFFKQSDYCLVSHKRTIPALALKAPAFVGKTSLTFSVSHSPSSGHQLIFSCNLFYKQSDYRFVSHKRYLKVVVS
jgi:hypothetical protein